MRPSCSPISCCRWSRWASSWNLRPAKGRSSTTRCARRPTWRPCARSTRSESLATCCRPCAWCGGSWRARVPLIGFAGAPFTLASYLIEGGSSRNYLKTKRLMYADPETWHSLMEKLAQVIADYLAGPGGSRRAGRAALRQLGRRAGPGRLPPVRAALFAGHLPGPGRQRRPGHPFRHRHAPRCWT